MSENYIVYQLQPLVKLMDIYVRSEMADVG